MIKWFFPLSLLLLASCSKVFYYPTRLLHFDPAQYKITPEEIFFEAEDGTKLFGWHFKSRQKPKLLIVFFHGNAQNISSHYLNLLWTLEYPIDFFIFDYRGYGRSEGTPDPKGTVMDGKAALVLTQKRALEQKLPWVAFGQSLGGAIALRSLIEVKDQSIVPNAIVVDSSFVSYQDVARSVLSRNIVTGIFQWLPYLFVSDTWAPGSRIRELAPTPLLVFHGDQDQTVAFSEGQKLFGIAGDPKEFVVIPGGRHTDVFFRENGKYRTTFLGFLEKNTKITLERISIGSTKP